MSRNFREHEENNAEPAESHRSAGVSATNSPSTPFVEPSDFSPFSNAVYVSQNERGEIDIYTFSPSIMDVVRVAGWIAVFVVAFWYAPEIMTIVLAVGLFIAFIVAVVLLSG